jgi:hypothetical protein
MRVMHDLTFDGDLVPDRDPRRFTHDPLYYFLMPLDFILAADGQNGIVNGGGHSDPVPHQTNDREAQDIGPCGLNRPIK